MLSLQAAPAGGGGCHESASNWRNRPRDPWDKRLGDHHRARRRCGPTHWADGQDGLAGGVGTDTSRAIGRNGAQLGWTAAIWLAYIVTEGPLKVSVETYLKGMRHTLSYLTAQSLDPLDLVTIA